MKEPTYRDALSHGWHLMVEHKVLWIFGLFAALLGQMGILDICSKVIVTAKYYTYYPFVTHLPEVMQAFAEAMRSWNLPFDKGVWLIWLVVLMLAFGFIFLFVAIVSQGALIHSVAQYIRGRLKLASHEAWHAGVSHFGRLLLLQIIKKIVVGALILFVGYGTYNFVTDPTATTTTVFVGSLLLAFFLGSITSLLTTYAAGYVVVEEYSFGKAVAAAWNLLKSHALVSIEVALMTLLINVMVGILAMLAVILFWVELAIISIVAISTNSFAVLSIGNTFSALILTAIFIVLGTFVTVFTTSVWTYLFMKMHKQGIRPRAKLFFERLLKR